MAGKPLIAQTLVKGEISMLEFIRQHNKLECQGQIFQLYKFSLNKKDASIKYLDLCFRFFNDEQKAYYFHSADKISGYFLFVQTRMREGTRNSETRRKAS